MAKKNAPLISAFTSKAHGLANVLPSEVSVYQQIPGQKPKIEKFVAIWDTGATSSVITPAVVKKLGLIASGKTNIHGVAGSKNDADTYFVTFILPNNVRVEGVRVTEVPQMAGNADMLIGMDIITLGDFSVTNVGGKTIYSFRIPSVKTIDYVDEINRSKPVKSIKKVGRNEPCPCGSGAKYKYCHGK